MLFYKDKLFCEINPTCYKISKGKEILKRNVRNTTERLELNRYCPRCRKHTVHKEKK